MACVVGGKPKDGQSFKVRGYERIKGFAHHMAGVCYGQVYEPSYNRVIFELGYPQELPGKNFDWKIKDSPENLKIICNQ